MISEYYNKITDKNKISHSNNSANQHENKRSPI